MDNVIQSAMVSNSTLAAVCVSSGLQEHLLCESQQLKRSIAEYAKNIRKAAEEEHRVARQENRRAGQYWVGIEPPKVGKLYPSSPDELW